MSATTSIGVPVGAVLVACLAVAGCFSQPLEAGDRSVLVTVEDLAAYGVRPTPGSSTVARRVRHLDRSLDIEYEFDTPDEADEPLYLSSSVGFERNETEARVALAAFRAVFGAAAKLGGLDVVADPEFYAWGDASFNARLEYEGRPVGNLLLTREGKRTHYLVISGIYFDDAETWSKLVEPKLERLRSFDP